MHGTVADPTRSTFFMRSEDHSVQTLDSRRRLLSRTHRAHQRRRQGRRLLLPRSHCHPRQVCQPQLHQRALRLRLPQTSSRRTLLVTFEAYHVDLCVSSASEMVVWLRSRRSHCRQMTTALVRNPPLFTAPHCAALCRTVPHFTILPCRTTRIPPQARSKPCLGTTRIGW